MKTKTRLKHLILSDMYKNMKTCAYNLTLKHVHDLFEK